MNFRLVQFNQVRYGRGADAARVDVITDEGKTEHSLWMSEHAVISNVMTHGPHIGLLDAAMHYNVSLSELVARWRAKGDKRFLNPMEPARSRDGYWRHPDWPGGTPDVVIDGWLNLIGYELAVVWMESDDDAEDVNTRYSHGDIDILAWEPKPPAEAAGWFIVSIHETEDGPVCIWLRPKP